MDIKIEKLVYGGEGLGHHDGHTVFVPFVLPDEVVSVRPIDKKKKFVRGRVEQVVTPSPLRASPPCRHFAVCGGCHYRSEERRVGKEWGCRVWGECRKVKMS